MTPLDLRIQFKMDTGEYPVWNNKNKSTFFGRYKSIYGLWLEEKLGNYKELRYDFYKLFGFDPVYVRRNCLNDGLNREYISWLEQKFCE